MTTSIFSITYYLYKFLNFGPAFFYFKHAEIVASVMLNSQTDSLRQAKYSQYLYSIPHLLQSAQMSMALRPTELCKERMI